MHLAEVKLALPSSLSPSLTVQPNSLDQSKAALCLFPLSTLQWMLIVRDQMKIVCHSFEFGKTKQLGRIREWIICTVLY